MRPVVSHGEGVRMTMEEAKYVNVIFFFFRVSTTIINSLIYLNLLNILKIFLSLLQLVCLFKPNENREMVNTCSECGVRDAFDGKQSFCRVQREN